jgi:hypothetical protein
VLQAEHRFFFLGRLLLGLSSVEGVQSADLRVDFLDELVLALDLTDQARFFVGFLRLVSREEILGASELRCVDLLLQILELLQVRLVLLKRVVVRLVGEAVDQSDDLAAHVLRLLRYLRQPEEGRVSKLFLFTGLRLLVQSTVSLDHDQVLFCLIDL